MKLSRARMRLTSWIASLAILIGAVAPAISHVLAASGHQLLSANICFAANSKHRSGTDPAPAPAAPAAPEHGMEHCLYCTAHMPVPMLPAADVPLLFASFVRFASPDATHATSHSFRLWAVAQPRAPPAGLINV